MYHAVLDVARDLIAALEEDVHHPAVLAKHKGFERSNALLLGYVSESFEQPGANPATLECIGDGERHLGSIDRTVGWIESREGNNPARTLADEGRAPGLFGVHEARQALRIKPRKTQEALIQTLLRQTFEESTDRWRVSFAGAAQRQS